MRPPASAMPDDESDRFDGTPHPRHAALLIGHDDGQQALLGAYRDNRLPHAIIIGGQAGIGKATLAWRLAKFLLQNPDPQSVEVRSATTLAVPAGVGSAAKVAALSHPDLVLLRREMNSKAKRFFTDIRADDVRRAMSLFQRAAGAGGWRICIVDSAEDLNRSSANALLKLIEEPPARSLFVLVSHRPGLILPTIRSRARLLRLASLRAGEIADVVRSLGSPFSMRADDEISAACANAEGSVHDALRRLEKGGLDFDLALRRLLDRLPDVDWREVHRLADHVAGRDVAAFETTMASIYAWLAQEVRGAAGQAPRRLAPYAEVWEKVAADARETDALNLDKRPLILSVFSDLAAAVRASSA